MKCRFPGVILVDIILLLQVAYTTEVNILVTADHYFPMNTTVQDKKTDVVSSAHMVAHNGVTLKHDQAVGNYLWFDGKDSWINSGGFDQDCLYDCTECGEGFSLSFWLKYVDGRFLISTGMYTKAKQGPGFQIVYNKYEGKIVWEVTSHVRSWRLKFSANVSKWIHYVFTWHEGNGIHVYGNGKMLSEQKESRNIRRRTSKYRPVMTIARPNKVPNLTEYGKFGITIMFVWFRKLIVGEALEVFRASTREKFRRASEKYGTSVATRPPYKESNMVQQQSTTTTIAAATATPTTTILPLPVTTVSPPIRQSARNSSNETASRISPKNVTNPRRCAMNKFPYSLAVHYWPLTKIQRSQNSEVLEDLCGFTPAEVSEGVTTRHDDQLGPVVSLNSVKASLVMNPLKSKCISDPTMCRLGITVELWLKFRKGECILSTGGYTKRIVGPGFILRYDGKKRHLVLQLSTTSKLWTLELKMKRSIWVHLAFVWKQKIGLTLYENGKFLTKAKTFKNVRYPSFVNKYRTLTVGAQDNLLKLKSGGQFQIGHLVIWTKSLSKKLIQGNSFLVFVRQSARSTVCCRRKNVDRCITDACYYSPRCENIDEKYPCICPRVKEETKCGKENPVKPCRDLADGCSELASQPNYCNYYVKQMWTKCSKSCQFCGYSTEVSSSVNTPKTPVADIHNTSSKASSRFLTPVQSAEFPRITTASEKSSSDSEVLTTAAHESTASGKTTLLESSHRPQSAVISKASTPVVPLPPKTMPLITETIGTQIETRIGTLMIERSISSKPHSITDTDIVSQFPHSSVGVTDASKLIESVFETLQHSSTITLRDSTSFQVLSDNSKPNSNTKSQFSSSSPSLQSAPPMENTVNSITETQTVVSSSVSKLQDSMLASSNTPSTHTTRSYQFSIPSTSSAVLTPKLTRVPSSITKIAQVFSVFSAIPQVSVSSNNTGDTSSLAHKVTTDIDEQTSLHQILSNATVNSLPMQTFKVVISSEINSSQKLPQTRHKLLSVTPGFQSTKTSDIISESKITIAVATIETTTSNMNATKDKNTSATTMFGNTAYYSGTVSEISSNLMVENTPSQNTHGSTVNALSTASFWASNPAAATSLPSSLSLSLAPTVLSQASGTENVQSAVDSLSASTTRLLQNIRKSTLDIYGLKLSTGSSWRSDSTKSTLVSINAAGFASSVQSTDMHEIRKSQSWLFTITARSSESISVSIYMSSADPSQTSNPTTTFESTSPSNVASTILSQISRTHKTQSEQHSLSVMIPQPSQTIRRSTSNTLSTDFVLPSSPTTSPTTTPASIPFSSIVLSQTANLNKTQRGGRSPSRLRIKSNASTKTSSHDKTSVTTKTTENATFQHTNTTLSKEAVIRPTPSIFDTKQTKPLNSTILVTNNTNQPNTLRQPATTQLTSSISRNNRPLATQTCYSSNGQRCVCYKGQRVVRRDEQVLPCSQLLTEQERQAVVVMELETLVLSQKFENRTKTTIAILVTEACNNGTYQCFPIARENNSLHSGINNHSLFAPPNSQFSANEMATTKDHGILRNFSITPHATNPVIHRMQNSLTMSIGNLPNVSRIQPWRTRSTTVLPVDHASVKFKRKRRKRSLVTRKVSIRVTASDVVVIEMRPVENNKPAWLTFLVKYRAVNSSDNLTRLLQPGTLSYIIVNNTKYLERMLNVSIRGVRVWEKQTVSSSTLRTRSFETFPTATGKSSSSVSKSVTDRTSSEAVNDDSKIMLVAIIVGVSCVLILLIIIAIVMVRINSKWQGEFIPNNQNGTVSPDHNTQEMITAGVDPAPRITDVPFKSPKPKKTTKMSLKRSEIMTSEI